MKIRTLTRTDSGTYNASHDILPDLADGATFSTLDDLTDWLSDLDYRRVDEGFRGWAAVMRHIETGDLIAIEDEPEYRAVDPVTGWQGPVHDHPDAARADADEHDAGCADQGGYGSAIVARRDDDGYCQDLDGQTIWPAHGHTSGALQWRTTPVHGATW